MKRRTVLRRIGTASAIAAAGAGSVAAEHDTVEGGGVGQRDDPPDHCTADTCSECLHMTVCEDCSDLC